MPVADLVTTLSGIDLSAWPRWLLVLLGTMGCALVIWIGIKLMKLALWLLFFCVMVSGVGWAAWLLLS
ncbi:MAG: hypothetical protein RL077_205 [Verrucomicrobiota bacterium]